RSLCLVLQFRKRTEADQRIYALRIPAGGDSPEPYFLCVVRVSPGGTLLTRERWEERRRVLQATYPDRGPEFLENESPAIGLRALREPVFAGPGGASFGLAFTTHDALFDVQLTATNRF
ncbi:MAG: hypothetical protein U5J83_04610, partial [Bryobacterales bacterium]|nr:hypothetical protein [Bryobacterales bacterium]